MTESFLGSMQIDLLDRRLRATRAQLATAIFENIEVFFNLARRHPAREQVVAAAAAPPPASTQPTRMAPIGSASRDVVVMTAPYREG